MSRWRLRVPHRQASARAAVAGQEPEHPLHPLHPLHRIVADTARHDRNRQLAVADCQWCGGECRPPHHLPATRARIPRASAQLRGRRPHPRSFAALPLGPPSPPGPPASPESPRVPQKHDDICALHPAGRRLTADRLAHRLLVLIPLPHSPCSGRPVPHLHGDASGVRVPGAVEVETPPADERRTRR